MKADQPSASKVHHWLELEQNQPSHVNTKASPARTETFYKQFQVEGYIYSRLQVATLFSSNLHGGDKFLWTRSG